MDSLKVAKGVLFSSITILIISVFIINIIWWSVGPWSLYHEIFFLISGLFLIITAFLIVTFAFINNNHVWQIGIIRIIAYGLVLDIFALSIDFYILYMWGFI